MTINLAAPKNILTTVGGALTGVPILISQSGLPISPAVQHYLTLASGIGVIMLGLAAKDFNTHSTIDQVHVSTAQAVAAGEAVSDTAKAVAATVVDVKKV